MHLLPSDTGLAIRRRRLGVTGPGDLREFVLRHDRQYDCSARVARAARGNARLPSSPLCGWRQAASGATDRSKSREPAPATECNDVVGAGSPAALRATACRLEPRRIALRPILLVLDEPTASLEADTPPQGHDAKCGFACHTAVQNRDYVSLSTERGKYRIARANQ
jgi:hypothetical protein